MIERVIPLVLCGLLAACSDPLAGLDRISDVDLNENDPSAAALPSEDEIAREGYFGTSAAEGDVPAGVAAPVAKQTPAKSGFFDLFRAAPADEQANAVAAAVAQTESQTEDAAPSVETSADETQIVALARSAETPVARGGFFGRLLGTGAADPAPEPVALETTTAASPEDLSSANVDPALEPAIASDAVPARRGLFGRKPAATAASRTGPDARDVDYDTVLPFGEVARACVASGRPLGRKVDKAPARGYTLYDTKPDTIAPRTFYITGFNDGCPRQLTAANVLLGSASLYERLHYGPGGENLPVAATDKAYEKIKRRVCGVSRRKPCGSNIRKMERSTFFVTAYSQFGNANSWSELLIHDGEVLAAAIKSNN